jgi:hypothetical protein
MTNKRGFDMDLLMRWFQFSAFCGIFRVHGCARRSDLVTTASGVICWLWPLTGRRFSYADRAPEMDTGTCSSDTSHASGLGLSPTSAHNEVYTREKQN